MFLSAYIAFRLHTYLFTDLSTYPPTNTTINLSTYLCSSTHLSTYTPPPPYFRLCITTYTVVRKRARQINTYVLSYQLFTYFIPMYHLPAYLTNYLPTLSYKLPDFLPLSFSHTNFPSLLCMYCIFFVTIHLPEYPFILAYFLKHLFPLPTNL